MSGAKLMTAGGGGVLLQPESSIATDVTTTLPVKGDSLVSGLGGGALSLSKQTISSPITVPFGYSASSVGPTTIASGVTVTVTSGSRWVVL